MIGWPIDAVKATMQSLLYDLREYELFNIVLFAGSSAVFSSDSLFATNENIENALNWLSKVEAGGGTMLLEGLKMVFNIPRTSGFARTIIIGTDGFITIENEAFEMIEDNLEGKKE